MRQAEVLEDLQADAVVAQVGPVAEGQVGLDGVEPLVLEGVGPELLDQADARALPGAGRSAPRPPRAPIISRARWSWSPQSQRSDSSRSPVKHDECIRTSGASTDCEVAHHEDDRARCSGSCLTP